MSTPAPDTSAAAPPPQQPQWTRLSVEDAVKRLKKNDPSLRYLILSQTGGTAGGGVVGGGGGGTGGSTTGGGGAAGAAAGLSDSRMKKLAAASEKSFFLKGLDLGGNSLGVKGARVLADMLKTNRTIKTLRLYDNDLTMEGSALLAGSLSTNSTLEELYLTRNVVRADGAMAASTGLSSNATLRVLDLGGGAIGPEGTRALAFALRSNRALSGLGLADNLIGNVGAEAMADCLRVNSSLRVVGLERNAIGPVGAKALALALKQNTTLERLGLGVNAIGGSVAEDAAAVDAAQTLADAIRNNAILKGLGLEQNAIRDSAAALIANAVVYSPDGSTEKVNTTLIFLSLAGNAIQDGSILTNVEAAMTANRTRAASGGGGAAPAPPPPVAAKPPPPPPPPPQAPPPLAQSEVTPEMSNGATAAVSQQNSKGWPDDDTFGSRSADSTPATTESKDPFGSSDSGNLFPHSSANGIVSEDDETEDEDGMPSSTMRKPPLTPPPALPPSQKRLTASQKAAAALALATKDDTPEIIQDRSRMRSRVIVSDDNGANADNRGDVSLEEVSIQVSRDYLEKSSLSQIQERRGVFGVVSLGQDWVLRRHFAINKIQLEPFLTPLKKYPAMPTNMDVLTTDGMRHPNIVPLIAHNISPDLLRGTHYLVSGIGKVGSLESLLLDPAGRDRLHWMRRLQIAYDVAKAIHFIHEGSPANTHFPCGFHQDVKSASIYLRSDFSAQLVECGLARLVSSRSGGRAPMLDNDEEDEDDDEGGLRSIDWERIVNNTDNVVVGSKGYVCPMISHIEAYRGACDVFSFGIVLAELILGKVQFKSLDHDQHDDDDDDADDAKAGAPDKNMSTAPSGELDNDNSHQRIKTNIMKTYVNGPHLRKLVQDVDVLAGEWPPEALKDMAALALECIRERPWERPPIYDVVAAIRECVMRHTQFKDHPKSGSGEEQSARSAHAVGSPLVEETCWVCHLDEIPCLPYPPHNTNTGHFVCVSCFENHVRLHMGEEQITYPIDGFDEHAFTDAEIEAHVSKIMFARHVGERQRRRQFKKLLTLQGQMVKLRQATMDANAERSDAASDLSRCFRNLPLLATGHTRKTPRLCLLVEGNGSSYESPQTWLSTPGQRKDVALYFLCEHSFTAVLPPMELKVTKEWIRQTAPALKISLLLLRGASEAGRLQEPLPISLLEAGEDYDDEDAREASNTVKLNAMDACLTSLMGSEIADDVEDVEACLGVLSKQEELTKLVQGATYEMFETAFALLAEKATEPECTKWRDTVEPVFSMEDGTIMWVKKEYSDLHLK